jgi:hypothetical protein
MTTPQRVGLVSALLIVTGFIIAMIVPRFGAGESRAVAFADLPKLFSEDNRAMGNIVIASYHEYRANAARWSGVYFGCVFGSAFLSALAAVVLKLESLQSWPRFRNDFAVVVAVLATLLTTLSTTGDFQRKWQANRLAAAEMENLAYGLVNAKSASDRDAVIGKIQSINAARNYGIVGEKAPDLTPAPAPSSGSGE